MQHFIEPRNLSNHVFDASLLLGHELEIHAYVFQDVDDAARPTLGFVDQPLSRLDHLETLFGLGSQCEDPIHLFPQ